MRKSILFLSLCLLSVAILSANAADEKKQAKKKAEPKCPVAGKPIDKDHFVMHNGGKVYFCCPNCPKAFEKDTAKYAVKANHQLAQTKQAKQVKCPLTGGPTKDDHAVGVAGVKVKFCCGMCEGKANGLKGAKRMELIFSDEAFKKGFEVGSAD